VLPSLRERARSTQPESDENALITQANTTDLKNKVKASLFRATLMNSFYPHNVHIIGTCPEKD
jgi:hypothetical protein